MMDASNLTLSHSKTTKSHTARPLPVNGGLSPYSGPWTYETAAHLLRRTMFGPTHEQIKQVVSDGLTATLVKLTSKPTRQPNPPVTYTESIVDPNVKKGETWVRAALGQNIQGLVQLKENSLYAWMMELMFNETVSMTEKMTLFWHNHFVTSDIYDPRMVYDYISLLRNHSLGNFKQLTKDIAIDKAMLIYLNGNQNSRVAPNENFARELMELFTLGKGETAGPGDYTTFTEMDVLAIAKALTGYTIFTDRNNPDLYPEVRYIQNRHDTTTKQLSHRFNNIQIPNANATEYQNVIDIIFAKREAATFICRKLYNFFIYYKIDDAIEQEIVDGMADILIASNFEISPVLNTLFASEHFYSIEALGCLIRAPYEYMFNTLKTLRFVPPTDLEQKYNLFASIYRNFSGMQQTYFNIPTVAGWDPYHQEPAYHEIWINSATLPFRVAFNTQFVNKSFRARNVTGTFGLDLPEYVKSLSNPSNVNELINEVVKHLLPQPIEQKQKDALKRVLLGNLTEAQWTTNWNNYANNPGNAQAKTAVDNRLKPFFSTLLNMPEYHLS
ncbi:MAG: DUF1800 domain-containing protein [Saprospiraceae bacterium]|nr:DUF1800 domain-containing protein [Saprospiraceae bacterium]MBK7812569.1 DUF1800 domain-containing protein [Saprospiraceae bacterium]MBK9630760.1 DUF1800 domain-containing protein [Saprospiraceae bacterium]